jgi:hypothetical protein
MSNAVNRMPAQGGVAVRFKGWRSRRLPPPDRLISLRPQNVQLHLQRVGCSGVGGYGVWLEVILGRCAVDFRRPTTRPMSWLAERAGA